MTDDISRIDIAEFRRLGYLQELNRRFLHPLGLALEVDVNEDGAEQLGGIWDYRDDPEGMTYLHFTDEMRANAAHVDAEFVERAWSRERALGYVVQPLDDDRRDDPGTKPV